MIKEISNAYIHIIEHTHTYTYIHIYIYIDIHTYTHIHRQYLYGKKKKRERIAKKKNKKKWLNILSKKGSISSGKSYNKCRFVYLANLRENRSTSSRLMSWGRSLP